MDLQHQLRMQFPNLQSHGMNHPPTDNNALFAKMIGWAQVPATQRAVVKSLPSERLVCFAAR